MATNAHWRRGRRECIELLFSDGRTLVCTPEHRIRSTEGWCEARVLTKGQTVVLGIEGTLYDPAEDNAAHLATFRVELDSIAPLHMTTAEDVARAHAFARLLGFFCTKRDVLLCGAEVGTYKGRRIDADRIAKDVELVTGEQCERRLYEHGVRLLKRMGVSMCSHSLADDSATTLCSCAGRCTQGPVLPCASIGDGRLVPQVVRA